MELPINFQRPEYLYGFTADGIKKVWADATPGPWRWEGLFRGSSSPFLMGAHSDRPIIMDFVRMGMTGATLRVRITPNGGPSYGVMVRTHDALAPKEIHPDLYAIEQAPAHVAWLLGEVERLQMENARLAALVMEVSLAFGIPPLHPARILQPGK